MRIDINEDVKTSGFGGFDKCFCIVTDGAQAMVGHHIGLSGLPRKKNR